MKTQIFNFFLPFNKDKKRERPERLNMQQKQLIWLQKIWTGYQLKKFGEILRKFQGILIWLRLNSRILFLKCRSLLKSFHHSLDGRTNFFLTQNDFFRKMKLVSCTRRKILWSILNFQNFLVRNDTVSIFTILNA